MAGRRLLWADPASVSPDLRYGTDPGVLFYTHVAPTSQVSVFGRTLDLHDKLLMMRQGPQC
jgi:hypothetical protein